MEDGFLHASASSKVCMIRAIQQTLAAMDSSSIVAFSACSALGVNRPGGATLCAQSQSKLHAVLVLSALEVAVPTAGRSRREARVLSPPPDYGVRSCWSSFAGEDGGVKRARWATTLGFLAGLVCDSNHTSQWMWSRGWTTRFLALKQQAADFNDSFRIKTEAYPLATGYPKLPTFPTRSHHIQSNRF